MSFPIRPRLGGRAISDMHPLMTPAQNHSDSDLGRGTQATSGGVKVISGGPTALGGIAPLSPFLPLPAALNDEDFKRRCSQDNDEKFEINDTNNRRSTNSDLADALRPKKKTRAPFNSSHMIRSYSMPVATQVDYEAERQASLQNFSMQVNFSPDTHWAHHFDRKVTDSNTMVSSLSSIGIPNTKYQQPQANRRSNICKSTKVSPRLQPRSPLSVITINGINNEADVDLSSGSDEADVITPRATSPREDYFQGQSLKKVSSVVPTFPDFENFIHPDHLRPPPQSF